MARYRFHDAADHLIAIPDVHGGVKLSLKHPISPLGVRFRDADEEGPGSVAEPSGSAEVRRTLFTHRPEAGDRLELETLPTGTIALVLISPAEEFVGTTPPMRGGKFTLPEAGNGKAWEKGRPAVTNVTDSQPAMLRKQNADAKRYWGV
jgi:hypothetical protein